MGASRFANGKKGDVQLVTDHLQYLDDLKLWLTVPARDVVSGSTFTVTVSFKLSLSIYSRLSKHYSPCGLGTRLHMQWDTARM